MSNVCWLCSAAVLQFVARGSVLEHTEVWMQAAPVALANFICLRSAP